MKQTKRTVGGHKVTLCDYGTPGGARFTAFYDALPASVIGYGWTAKEAIANLKLRAAEYGAKRQAEIAREDWDEHEADKADALRRGDY